jgi:hypothetical protein
MEWKRYGELIVTTQNFEDLQYIYILGIKEDFYLIYLNMEGGFCQNFKLLGGGYSFTTPHGSYCNLSFSI